MLIIIRSQRQARSWPDRTRRAQDTRHADLHRIRQAAVMLHMHMKSGNTSRWNKPNEYIQLDNYLEDLTGWKSG